MKKYNFIYNNVLWRCIELPELNDAISFGYNAGLRMGKVSMVIEDENGTEIFSCLI